MKIRLIGLPSGVPTPFDGEFLKEYDPARPGVAPDGREMIAHIVTTPDPDQARQFATAGEAFALYRLAHGVRPDGLPNRPLTAFSMEVV